MTASRIVHILQPDRAKTHCGRPLSRYPLLPTCTEEQYDDTVGVQLCAHCVGGFQRSLSTRGLLFKARFAPRRFPEVIWVNDELIVGPFCVHCGNPSYMHGPGARCRSGRIHPLLPLGDLPRAGASTAGAGH